MVGAAEHMGLAVARGGRLATGEAQNVAVSLATTGVFGDAFAVGQGPTAHLMPVGPFVGSLAYRALGVGEAASLALSLWATLLVLGAFALFAWAARLTGAPRGACVVAYAVLAVLPVYTAIEAIDFRVWEGAIALVLAGALLCQVLRHDGRPAGVGLGAIAASATVAALLLLTHPTLGLAGYAMLALFAWRNLPPRRAAGAAVAALLALGLAVVPWTLRNRAAMGTSVLLRDNAGLELAVADYPGNVAPANPRAERARRLADIHPFDSPSAYAKMAAAGGEAAYARKLGAETRAWMAAHPGATLRLLLRHLRETLFPPAWMFETAHGRALPLARSVAACLATILGLAGLWRARRIPRSHYWAGFVGVVVLAYVPFQPVGRYTWLVYVPMTCLAALLAVRRDRAR